VEYNILLVDDDSFIINAIAPALEREGYKVTTAECGETAIDRLKSNSYDLVLTDLVMDPVDGIAVLKTAKKIHPEIPVIILTGYGDMTSAVEALRLKADDYLLKPCELEEIFIKLARCFEELELKRKIKIYEKMLPVCCVCKKIRDDRGKEPGRGDWMQMELYIQNKAKVKVTSTYCPECAQKAMAEVESL